MQLVLVIECFDVVFDTFASGHLSLLEELRSLAELFDSDHEKQHPILILVAD